VAGPPTGVAVMTSEAARETAANRRNARPNALLNLAGRRCGRHGRLLKRQGCNNPGVSQSRLRDGPHALLSK
jgi:hypothetical protein